MPGAHRRIGFGCRADAFDEVSIGERGDGEERLSLLESEFRRGQFLCVSGNEARLDLTGSEVRVGENSFQKGGIRGASEENG